MGEIDSHLLLLLYHCYRNSYITPTIPKAIGWGGKVNASASSDVEARAGVKVVVAPLPAVVASSSIYLTISISTLYLASQHT